MRDTSDDLIQIRAPRNEAETAILLEFALFLLKRLNKQWDDILPDEVIK